MELQGLGRANAMRPSGPKRFSYCGGRKVPFPAPVPSHESHPFPIASGDDKRVNSRRMGSVCWTNTMTNKSHIFSSVRGRRRVQPVAVHISPEMNVESLRNRWMTQPGGCRKIGFVLAGPH